MSLRTRVLIIAGLVLVAVAGLIGGAAQVVFDLRSALEVQRLKLLPAVRLVDAYDNGIREQQRGERGYVITSDGRFLTNYEEGKRASAAASEELHRHLTERPELDAKVRALDEARDRWEVAAAAPAVAAASRNDRDEAARIVGSEGRFHFEEVQDRRRDLEVSLESEVERLGTQLADHEDRLLLLLWGAAAVALLILALVVAALDRWVIAPVERLSATVRAVAAGQLEETVSVDGPREVVELASDVDAMRLRILSELEEMRRSNEALAQQAPLVVELRDVLLPAAQAPSAVEMASLFLPAEGVLAGDWFDVWTLDDGRVGIVVSDISGHGAEAGLFALRLKDLLGSAVVVMSDPGVALKWVADRLGDTGERFATIFLAVLDCEGRSMRYANAGHPPVLLVRPSAIVSLLPTGPLLGPFESTWHSLDANLDDGAILVAYTDGLIEARSPSLEEFGATRLVDLLTRLRGQSPHDVVAGCRSVLEDFSSGRFQDDVTLVAVSLAAPR